MSEESVEIVRRLYAHWERGAFPEDFYDAEVEHLRIAMEAPDVEGQWRGLDGLRASMIEYFDAFTDLRIEAEQIVDLGGDRVLVLSRQTARGRTSGVPTDHEVGDLFTLQDGKIVRVVTYWDRDAALEAAGLSE